MGSDLPSYGGNSFYNLSYYGHWRIEDSGALKEETRLGPN